MKGTVERFEVNSDYEYVIRLTLKFAINGVGEPTSSIHITEAALSAIVSDDTVPKTLQRVLLSTSRKITASFTADGKEETLEELRFQIAKSVESQADRITLGFIDGPVTWELPVNLKRLQHRTLSPLR